MTRDALLAERNKLMQIVEAERAEDRKHGFKHDSRKVFKILNKVWNLDDQIMKLT